MQIGDNKRHVRFTVYGSTHRLSKRYDRDPGGGLTTLSGTQFASGGYYVCAIPADGEDCHAILAVIGAAIDKLSSRMAIGFGVPKDGSKTGVISTKAKLQQNPSTSAIARSLKHFAWPEPGLLLLDGDDIDGVAEILIDCYPAFEEVATLTRKSASASVIDPQTGQQFKRGEHVYCLLDEPALSADCLKAMMRLAWVGGHGHLMLSKRGDVLVRGPIDACVGSPERLSYEGEAVIGRGIERLPRVSQVGGGHKMLCARDLIAVADRNAPVDRYEATVNAAKDDRAFCQRRDAARVAYRGVHIAKAVKRGIPRAKAAKNYDAAIAAGTTTVGARTWCPLPDEHVLCKPDGKEFTLADVKANPAKFHNSECADPIEGLSYKSRNCAIIYTDGGQIRIYSRAHGDAYAYYPASGSLIEDEAVAKNLNELAAILEQARRERNGGAR